VAASTSEAENWIQVVSPDPTAPDYISVQELTHNGKYKYRPLAKEQPTESDLEDFFRERVPVMRIDWNELETSWIKLFGLSEERPRDVPLTCMRDTLSHINKRYGILPDAPTDMLNEWKIRLGRWLREYYEDIIVMLHVD